MLRIHEALATGPLAARMLLQVHDELVFEVPTGEVEALTALVKECMEGAATLAVPLVVDVGVGPNWLASKG
jgi:DNA polymerase-1